jgi:predicted nucleic acid-binding OB-fold protein
VSQKQLEAIPGIGEKTAWKLISQRAKRKRKNPGQEAFDSAEEWFKATSIDWSEDYSLYFDHK